MGILAVKAKISESGLFPSVSGIAFFRKKAIFFGYGTDKGVSVTNIVILEVIMEFDCNVKIVDAMMGAGKSSAAINYINQSEADEKFLVITPYLPEVERYRKECPTKHFKQPTYGTGGNGTKLGSLKTLINRGENIVSTHALFQKFDNEVIDLCRASHYTLIMDEVAEQLKDSFVVIEEDTNLIHWREDKSEYEGRFSDIKNLCDLGSLAYYNGSVMMWLFPIRAFNAFRNVYILTYMFSSQMQRYYYDYYGLPYQYLSVSEDNGYHFVEGKSDKLANINYHDLIHVLDSDKMNSIGDRKGDLSLTWFERNKNNNVSKKLKNNLLNFFQNIRGGKAKDCLWTTFKDYKHRLQGKGYTKGFLAINARATNDYQDRTSVAYIANRYMDPVIKNFFVQHNIDVDEDGYALSEMLQFIWRSAIRQGKEIWIYIPSIRMRTLLIDWINNESN